MESSNGEAKMNLSFSYAREDIKIETLSGQSANLAFHRERKIIKTLQNAGNKMKGACDLLGGDPEQGDSVPRSHFVAACNGRL